MTAAPGAAVCQPSVLRPAGLAKLRAFAGAASRRNSGVGLVPTSKEHLAVPWLVRSAFTAQGRRLTSVKAASAARVQTCQVRIRE